MNWFDINKLEKQIRENEFSDKEVFKYFLVNAIFTFIQSYGSSSLVSTIVFLEFLVGGAITIYGTYAIFRANSSGDGLDFFKRYFPLSIVVGIRLLVIICLPILIIFALVRFIFYTEYVFSQNEKEIAMMIFGIIITAIYYFQLTNSFKRVSAKEKFE
jgi:hypothetical protein